jgi:hypothetical protein
VSLSLRDRRFTVYTLTETTVDGVPTKSYHLSNTWWGRLVPPSGHEKTLGLAADHTVDGIIALSDEATVTVNDVLLDEDDVVYEVRAVLPRRMLAETHVLVERSTQADGTHNLVES